MKYSMWLVLLVAACGSDPAFPSARFANAPPATIVNDRREVAKPPAKTTTLETLYGYRALYGRMATRSMELPPPMRARGVNAFDEVPDSTWFTNRRDLTPEQVRTGPVTVDNPELHLPWTIESTKFGGSSAGFIIVDARGVKYLLKFDDPQFPEVESGTDAVVDRLVWAAGYNVPEDQVVYFRPEQLRLAPNAVQLNEQGGKLARLEPIDVAINLKGVAREKDGRIRALASRWLDGKALGGHPVKGVRRDDPNDRIPHELRRDLRGMYAVYAWLDMVDVWPGNFLDTWSADPADPDRHYVKHYSLDFGQSLGTMAVKASDLRLGYVYRADWPQVFASLFTAGLVRWDWEQRPIVRIPGVAMLFSAIGFDPGKWHPDLPYLPFQAMDRFDGFWGAKIVARFTRDQIHAAVLAGRYTDPRAVDYITDTLVARQRRTAAYWYARVNPLDALAVVDGALCFDDLAIGQGYVPRDADTHYAVVVHDPSGRVVGPTTVIRAQASGHSCVRLPPLIASQPDGYTILEVVTTRPGFKGTTYVHVARDPHGVPQVIGIWRV
jgi:hypothetical protein